MNLRKKRFVHPFIGYWDIKQTRWSFFYTPVVSTKFTCHYQLWYCAYDLEGLFFLLYWIRKSFWSKSFFNLNVFKKFPQQWLENVNTFPLTFYSTRGWWVNTPSTLSTGLLMNQLIDRLANGQVYQLQFQEKNKALFVPWFDYGSPPKSEM